MSSAAADSNTTSKVVAANTQSVDASPNAKGKGKAPKEDQSMEEEEDDDDEDDEDEDDEEEGSEEEEDEDDSLEEINPSAIMSGRRTRGVKVDYTSAEALAKAGLKNNEKDDDDDDEEMKEN
ncbi:histone H2A.Z-specific chaperone CHZ1 [Lentinula aciculospora]|uniref:Histone H2A.Z-specific chaperone CHZ1 n=1 Tax=Lentinula aciculospora TaxID=153920 RepID=A0A9W9DTL0_9AGAR|nr:histone H2A.Z-specific chaperone CHZ1 [Lentinula aciculospora]